MPATRIYIVRDPEIDGCEELIEATSAPTALRYVAARRYRVTVATPKQVAELLGNGVHLQTAGEETEKAGA